MEVHSLQYHIVQRQRSAGWEQQRLAGGEVFLQMQEDGLRLLYRLPDSGSLCALDEIRFTRNLDSSEKILQFRHFIPESMLSETEFSKITIATDPANFTLIPEEFFSEESKTDLLLLTGELAESDAVFSEKTGNGMRLVFSVAREWTDWASGIFQPAELHWTCLFSGMLQNILSESKPENLMLAHIGPGRLHCFGRKHGQFCFFNRFDFKTEQDLLYFFLLAMEQCRLDPEKDPVQLCGSIMSGSAGFEKLSRYAGNLNFAVSGEIDSLLPAAAGIRHPVYFDLLTLLSRL